MPPEPTDPPRAPDLVDQIVRVLRSLDFLISDVQAVWASRLKLTVPQWNILMLIADAQEQGGLSVKSVADGLQVNPSFIVLQSKPLESRGLIQRKTSTKDKRYVYLSLTPKAIKELRHLAASRQAVSSAIKKEMGEAATLHTIELMRQLERCMDRCHRRLQIEE